MKRQLTSPHSTAAKRILLRALLPLCFISVATIADGQSWVNPNNPDQTLVSGTAPGATQWIENASLDYNTSTSGVLMAAVYDDVSNQGFNLVINDQTGGPAFTQFVSSGPGTYTFPGESTVILGGDNTAGQTTFYGAVFYIATNSTGSNDLFMQTMIISNPGIPGMLNVNLCPTPVQLTTSGLASWDRADIIAKNNGTYVNADNFVVSWMESGNLMAMHFKGLAAWANACNIGSPLPVPSAVAIAGPSSPYPMNIGLPDVAGTERSLVNSIDDIAIFTYVGTYGGNNALFFQEWDMNSPSPVTPPHPIDVSSYVINNPRIDAIDCHSINTPSGQAYFEIAYNKNINGTAAGWNVFSANILGISNCTSGNMVTTGADFPTVACGPSTQYDLAYNGIRLSSQDNYSQQVSWSGSLTPTGTTYQRINSTFGADRPAISSTVNNLVPDNVFVCWLDGGGNLEYKITGSPVSYKPTGVSNVTAADNNWKLSPNPATDHIVLTASGNNWQGATYVVRDITGRTIAQGNVINAQQQIATAHMPAGMYLLNITDNTGTLSAQKFVKE